MRILLRCFIYLISSSLSLLYGCTDELAPPLLQDYMKRVENATGFADKTSTKTTLELYPSHRHRTLPADDIRIGFVDFFKLYDCDLFALVNERNSIMGKVMPASRKLVYEINFYQSAGRCLQKLEQAGDTEKIRDKLESIISAKQEALHRALWNATFDSPEMQKTFSLAGGMLPFDTTAAFTESRRAIDYFIDIGERLTDPILAVDIDEMEAHNYALQLHRYGGRLARTLVVLTDYLNRATNALQRSARTPTLCPQGTASPQADSLMTVFSDSYRDQVEPFLTSIHREGDAWLQAVNRLVSIQRVDPPEAFVAYHSRMLSMDSEQGLWRAFGQARQQHADAWKTLLEKCRS